MLRVDGVCATAFAELMEMAAREPNFPKNKDRPQFAQRLWLRQNVSSNRFQ
jgi:hypothetical protein